MNYETLTIISLATNLILCIVVASMYIILNAKTLDLKSILDLYDQLIDGLDRAVKLNHSNLITQLSILQDHTALFKNHEESIIKITKILDDIVKKLK